MKLCHGASHFSYSSVYLRVQGQIAADCRAKVKWSETWSGLLSIVITGLVATFWLMTTVFFMLTVNPNFWQAEEKQSISSCNPSSVWALSQENLRRELTGSALEFDKKSFISRRSLRVGIGQRAVRRCDIVLLTTASL